MLSQSLITTLFGQLSEGSWFRKTLRCFILVGFFLTSIIILSLFSSCTATRFIPEDKSLLNKNSVVIHGVPKNFVKSDLEYLIAQKPNNKFLGNRFALWIHYFLENRRDKKLWNWFYDKAGQAPVYVDMYQNENTAQQLTRYTYNKGYFNNTVTHEVTRHKNGLATVFYHVTLNQPYTISEISKTMSDSILKHYIDSIGSETLIKKDALYDAYLLDNERDRITNYLKNNGYFNFTKDYILFDVDSSLKSNQININMIIENPSNRDKTIAASHKRYFINDIFIFPTYDPFVNSLYPYDTSVYFYKNSLQSANSKLTFLAIGDKRIKASIFSNIIQIYEDEPFSINKLRQTYKGLTNLKIYRASTISFDTVRLEQSSSVSDTNWLNCNIYLQRSKVNSYSIELEGTNSGGDLGIRGGLVFSNKNLFKGAEVLRLRLNGGIEAQRISEVTIGDNVSSSIFNTTEVGVDANIYFPRFLSPVALRKFAKEYQPKTNVSIGFSDQKRTYYSRTILKAAFGYDWMTKPTVQHLLTPINLSSVKVTPSPAFQEFLDKQTNQRFKDQYSDHLIFSAKYSFIYNNQNVNKLNNFIYYRANIESAGNVLALFNNTALLDPENDYHTLLGTRYSQYFKLDNDFRYYRLITSEQRIVFRTMMGIGLPFGNSDEMPFEQSFYSGGANGMRGWQLRQLGPGSFIDTVDIERIGDIQLEFNVEYRFPVWSYLKGALFIDAGNIWTLQEKPYYKNGSFDVKSFYKEFAIDAGVGFRFDFSFFIFRLDTAIPLRDPEYPIDQRWRFKTLQLNQLVWNFGIGYPF